MQVTSDGRVHVSTGLTSQGQGHETAFAQIAATELGVPIEKVSVVTGDTRRFGYAVGTFASRAAVMSGNAIALACRKVREKALRIAAEALEADPRDLEITDGTVHVAGVPSASIPLATVAVLSNPLRYAFDEETRRATQFAGPASDDRPPVAEEEPGLEGRDYYSPVRSTFAAGMHAAIVETDPDTAEIRILRYAVVHDCGRLINPMIVEGQIHGGVAQGVGGALYEKMVYDEHGQLLNASFMDFLMPYATEVPHIETAHLETPSPLNPLGIKGAGEAGVIPVSAVIASAVEDAEGITIARMPISPPTSTTCASRVRERSASGPSSADQRFHVTHNRPGFLAVVRIIRDGEGLAARRLRAPQPPCHHDGLPNDLVGRLTIGCEFGQRGFGARIGLEGNHAHIFSVRHGFSLTFETIRKRSSALRM
ncbi:hypothetical protein GCM10027612_64770 [Microbispora bryophytorum subsp. camponoti]